MALTQQSLAAAVRRKARRAQQSVKVAEQELSAANEALKEALPRHDEQAIAQAAVRTMTAEEEVREAAHELEAVNELLADGTAPPPGGTASGEGASSLLPYLRGR